ncbi:MAG: hypothetical protein D3909_13030, partial [Candidatus Electrothrix sp. ATG1]|nr:hypothetical protein [Candidatus Electrothrix sp. ATG1]
NTALLMQGQPEHTAAKRIGKERQGQVVLGRKGEAVLGDDEIGCAVGHYIHCLSKQDVAVVIQKTTAYFSEGPEYCNRYSPGLATAEGGGRGLKGLRVP